MNAKTDTPMTDALFTGDMDAETISHMVTLSRRLERDRAELIEALAAVVRHNTAGLPDQFVDDVRDARALLARMREGGAS